MAATSMQENVPVLEKVRGLNEMTLPNGQTIFCFGRVDARTLYDEIFVEGVYARCGIEIKEGDQIVDIGANIGMFLLYANQKCARAKVWSFEPVPDTFEALRRNRERHNRIDAKIFRKGLSDREGTAEISFFPLSSAMSSLTPDATEEGKQSLRDFIAEYIRRYAIGRLWWALTPRFLMNFILERIRAYCHWPVKIPIELTTLERVIDEEGIDRIDLLKCDTEGAEYAIIPSIPDRVWPMIRQVVVETHGNAAGRKLVEETLLRHGFTVQTHGANPHFPSYALHYARRVGVAEGG